MVKIQYQKPAVLKLNTGLSFGISDEGRIKACQICGQTMKSSTIYPYNEPAVTSFICINETCLNYNQFSFGKRHVSEEG